MHNVPAVTRRHTYYLHQQTGGRTDFFPTTLALGLPYPPFCHSKHFTSSLDLKVTTPLEQLLDTIGAGGCSGVSQPEGCLEPILLNTSTPDEYKTDLSYLSFQLPGGRHSFEDAQIRGSREGPAGQCLPSGNGFQRSGSQRSSVPQAPTPSCITFGTGGLLMAAKWLADYHLLRRLRLRVLCPPWNSSPPGDPLPFRYVS